MKKYLEDLRQELIKQKMTAKEIEEIIADHEEMIRTALAEGLSVEEIKAKFGDPSQLAEELSDFDSKEDAEQEETDDYVLWQEFEVNDEFVSINVNLLSEDITYQSTDETKVKVFYCGKRKIDKYELSFEKNELRLSAPRKFGFHFSFNNEDDLTFLIEIPKNVMINELKHVAVSSDMELKNLIVKQMTLNTTSGDLKVKHASLGVAKWHTVNGDIEIKETKFLSLNSSQVNGDILMKEVTIDGDFKVNTVSGDVELQEVTCDNFEVNTVSGDVNGKEFYPKMVALKSVSGDISIKNKEDRYIEIVKKHSVSGDIHIGR